MTVIDVQHVAKSFGDVRALRDASLQVPEGSIHGFLGPNGAGKTTLLRGLIGMQRFSAGSARVLGQDPWKDRVALHERIGYLPGGMGMYPRMRGSELLDYAASLSRRALGTPLRQQALDALQLSARDLARQVRTYSKGMRQKLAIVQAVQHAPELLLMDEPSEGLDPLVQYAVYELLRELASTGTTVLFSSHTLSEVEALCDRVSIIRSGETVIEATLEELRAQRPRTVRVLVDDVAGLDALFTDGCVRLPDDQVGRTVFQTHMDADELVRKLSGIHLSDLIIDESSLDDIFRSYYEEGR